MGYVVKVEVSTKDSQGLCVRFLVIHAKKGGFLFLFLFSSKDTFSFLLEREEGRERNNNVRNIDWLPPICAWTGD